VLKGSLSAYRAATYWNEFVNIVEFDVTAVNNPANSTTKITLNSATKTIEILGIDTPTKVAIYSTNGILVKSSVVSIGESLPIKSLPKGIYVIKMLVNNDLISQKVVI
jgi:hypothetical protein